MKDLPIIFSGPMVRALLDGSKTMTRRLLRVEVPDPPSHANVHENNTPRHAAPYLDAYCSERHTAVNPRGMGRNWCWWTRDDRCCEQFRVGYVPGDRLWVREKHYRYGQWVKDGSTNSGRQRWRFLVCNPAVTPGGSPVRYVIEVGASAGASSRTEIGWHLRPSIFLPRELSRTTLVITGVKVERLQDISVDDAWAEGVNRRSSSVRQSWLFGATAEERQAIYRWACPWEFQQLWKRLHGDASWDANPYVVALTFTVQKQNIDTLPRPEARAA